MMFIKENAEKNSLGLYLLDDYGEEQLLVESVCGSIRLDKILISQLSNERTYIFEYYDLLQEKSRKFKCKRRDLSSKGIRNLLENNGIDVLEENEKELARYMQSLVMEKKEYDECVSVAGFNEDYTCFYTNKVIKANEEGSYIEQNARFKDALGPFGDKKIYDNMLREHVNYSEIQLGYVLGFAGTMSSYVRSKKDCGVILVSLCGESSSGKTTTTLLATSAFSKPEFNASKGFARTSNGTQLALMESLRNVRGITVSIDDISACYKGNLEELVYGLESGQSKGHMNKDYTYGEVSSWNGLILTNSEKDVLPAKSKLGAKARLISLDKIAWTKNGKQAIKIKQVVEKNYGFYGEVFAKSLLELGQTACVELIEKCQQEILAGLNAFDSLTDRRTIKLAVILASAIVLSRILSDTISLDVEGIKKHLINAENEAYAIRNYSLNLKAKLLKFIEENQSHFISRGDKRNDYYGFITKEGQNKYYYILDTKLENFLENEEVNSKKDYILHEWLNEEFLIRYEKDRLYYKKMREGKYLKCYKFKVKDSEIV